MRAGICDDIGIPSHPILTCRPPALAILISAFNRRERFLLVQALLLLICTPAVFAQPDSREAGRFLTQTFSPRDFVGDAYISYAAQGRGGLMYFANLDGVRRRASSPLLG